MDYILNRASENFEETPDWHVEIDSDVVVFWSTNLPHLYCDGSEGSIFVLDQIRQSLEHLAATGSGRFQPGWGAPFFVADASSPYAGRHIVERLYSDCALEFSEGAPEMPDLSTQPAVVY